MSRPIGKRSSLAVNNAAQPFVIPASPPSFAGSGRRRVGSPAQRSPTPIDMLNETPIVVYRAHTGSSSASSRSRSNSPIPMSPTTPPVGGIERHPVTRQGSLHAEPPKIDYYTMITEMITDQTYHRPITGLAHSQSVNKTLTKLLERIFTRYAMTAGRSVTYIQQNTDGIIFTLFKLGNGARTLNIYLVTLFKEESLYLKEPPLPNDVYIINPFNVSERDAIIPSYVVFGKHLMSSEEVSNLIKLQAILAETQEAMRKQFNTGNAMVPMNRIAIGTNRAFYDGLTRYENELRHHINDFMNA